MRGVREMAEHYKNLEKAMCKELEKLDKKYTADVEMTPTDAERADMLYHALKSAATYHAMKDAEDEDWDEGDEESGRPYRMNRGRSYARARDSRTGRYMSRDGGMDYSGRYPMEYIEPYWDRRM
jgi:hypothetical protein